MSFLLDEVRRVCCAELLPAASRSAGLEEYTWQENLMRIVLKWVIGILLVFDSRPDAALFALGCYLMWDAVFNAVAYKEDCPATFLVEGVAGLIRLVRGAPVSGKGR